MKKAEKKFRPEYTMIIPVVILAVLTWGVFWLYPNLETFELAFTNRELKFTFDNFKEAFNSFSSKDGTLFIAMKNTITFWSFDFFVNIPVSIVISYFLYKKIAGYKVFRVVFYLSHILPSVALTGVFKAFISVTGPLGQVCSSLGIVIQNEGLLNTVGTVIPTILVYSFIIGCSGSMLLLSGAMARIPTEVLEAAKLDGCSLTREVFQIILPLIWPTITTIIILKCSQIIAAGGGLVMLLQPNTQQYGTETLYYWMFKKVQGSNVNTADYGLVAATGLILTAFIVPFITIVRKVLDRYTEEY